MKINKQMLAVVLVAGLMGACGVVEAAEYKKVVQAKASGAKKAVKLSTTGKAVVEHQLVNGSEDQVVFATVKTVWNYKGETRSQTNTYRLEPGASRYVGKVKAWGLKYERLVTGARYQIFED